MGWIDRFGPTGDHKVLTGAILGWLGVGLYGVWEMADTESGDGWWQPYLLFAISLLLAAICTTATAWSHSRTTEPQSLRRAGLVVGVVAVAASLVAWAQPLWMTLLAVSCGLFAIAAPLHLRRGIAMVAAAQVVGMAVLFAAITAQVGPQDSYGDYPVAFGLGNVVTAAGSLFGLAILALALGSRRLEPTIAAGQESPSAL